MKIISLILFFASLALSAPIQDAQGRIALPFSEAPIASDKTTYTWNHTATRWGMYRIGVIPLESSGAKPAPVPPLTVTIGEKSLRIDGKSADLRIYIPAAGKIAIRAEFDAKPEHLAGLALIPAPEGDLNLAQDADGSVLLHSKDSTVHGVKARYEPKPEKNTIGFWTEQKDWASWDFQIKTPGKFEVHLFQGCGPGHGGSQVGVELAGQALTFTVQDTGHFQNFIDRNIGTVTLARPGRHTLIVKPLTKAKAAVMDLRQVKLIPIR